MWWQRLAIAVLQQALDDARSRAHGADWRRQVTGWLTHSSDCALWCAIAGLDHEAFVAGVRREIAAESHNAKR